MLGSRMFGVIRRVAGVAGLVLFSLPVSAQSRLLSAATVTSTPQPALSVVIPAERSFVPATPGVRAFPDHPVALQSSVDIVKSHFLAAQNASLFATSSLAADRSMAARMGGAFEEVKTPFLAQVRVALISMGSGRVQLSGFQSVAPMQNLVWGLPLKASALGGSVVQQCHPGIRPPDNNQSYGLSLHLRFSKQDADKAGNGLWKAARRAMSWSPALRTV